LLVQTPAALKARFNIDIHPNSEVVAIQPKQKQLIVQNDIEKYTMGYDKLILAPGAKPVLPVIPGLDTAKTLFTLRSVPNADVIMNQIESNQPQTATIIGAGFIGLEMAENLAHRGIRVTIVEKASHVLPSFDEEMAAIIQKELKEQDITLWTNASAVAFKEKGKKIVLDNDQVLQSDLVILSVGVQPENSLAKAADIELGLQGGILVNE